jgi:hypothetical protein
MLLDEEMRRFIEYSRWKSRNWTARSSVAVTTDPQVNSGICAYAVQQGWMFSQMAKLCVGSWRDVRLKAKSFLENNESLGEQASPGPSGHRIDSREELVDDGDDVLNGDGEDDLAWEIDAWALDDEEDICHAGFTLLFIFLFSHSFHLTFVYNIFTIFHIFPFQKIYQVLYA